MTSTTTKPDSLQPAADMAGDLFDNWFDPLEAEVRARSREFIEELLRGELEAALSRPRYGRIPMSGNEGRASVAGHRHGSRTRSLTGTFGPIEIAVPRARLTTADGKTTEWKSQTLRAYQRRTLAADALIASTYLAGTNTRRVRRALAALFGGTVGKDTVSRTWRKVKSDWDAWHTRSLTGEPIVRLILDGTVVRVRLDRKATSISLLVVLGVRWRSVRTTNAIERLHEEFKRRIKTQTVLPSADTAAMLFWALLASGQINMRKVDGWQTLAVKPGNQPIDLAA
ncbi:transposase-like protein [Bradyrhizobium sp. AZCC 2289]